MASPSEINLDRSDSDAREPSVASLRLPRSMLLGFREAGADVDALAERVGLDRAQLEDRVAPAQMEQFLSLAFDAVRDPTFGLTLGTRVRPELFGVAGFVAMSAATYGAALARLARYKRMFSGDRIEIAPSGSVTSLFLHLSMSRGAHARQVLDLELSFLVSFGRYLTGQPIRPERVAMRFSRPSYHARYEELFGCPMVFEAPADALVFSTADLELPLVSANAELASIFEEKAEQILSESLASPDLAERVRAILRRSMRGEVPDIAVVSKQLATSERSLQRKLQQEGTSYQQLVSEVRFELARRHLRDIRADAAEVSFLLGFSHPNSFYRAFKRWTGMTPDEYRRREATGRLAAG